MKSGSRGSTDTRERFGMRRALVVTQVALSLVLVVGAVLFVRSLRNLMTLDAGFTQDGILVVNLDLRRTGVAEERRTAFFADLTARLAGLPGVTSAAQAFIVPVSGSGWNNNIIVDGKKYSENVNFNQVSAGYFRTMGTPLLAGRDFDERDKAGAEKSVIVTQLFAQKFFPGKNPLDQVFQIDERPGQPQPLHRIVGLVKDTKYTDLREELTPLVFYDVSQDEKPDPFLQVVMRSIAPLESITSEVTSVAGQMNSNIIVQFQTLKTLVRDSLLRERLMATLSGFFGALRTAESSTVYSPRLWPTPREQTPRGSRPGVSSPRTAELPPRRQTSCCLCWSEQHPSLRDDLQFLDTPGDMHNPSHRMASCS